MGARRPRSDDVNTVGETGPPSATVRAFVDAHHNETREFQRASGPISIALIGEHELLEAWRAEFAGWGSAVETHEGRFEERFGDFEALVAPGNSYGQINGGIDGAIAAAFPLMRRAVWGA